MKLMKKKMLCIVSLLCIVMGMSAQNPYERKWNVVHVDRPGNLIPCIFKTIHARADNLEIHGEINGSDLLMLNLIMGGWTGICGYEFDGVFPRYREWKAPNFYLCPREIDLSDARIVPGDWYSYIDVWGEDETPAEWLYAKENTIGPQLFLDVDSLKRLVLPEGTKIVHQYVIGTYSDDSCYLNELVVPASVEYFSVTYFNEIRRIVFKGTEPPVGTLGFAFDEEGNQIDLPDYGYETPIVTDEEIERYGRWNDELLRRTTLVVPDGCREKYMKKSLWRFAKEIIEESELSGIKDAEADGNGTRAPQTDDRSFRLDGRLAQPGERGIVVHEGRKELKR